MGMFHLVDDQLRYRIEYLAHEQRRDGAGDRAGPDLACRMRSRLALARFMPDFWRGRTSCFTSAPFSPHWPRLCRSASMPSSCRRPRMRGRRSRRARCNSPPMAGACCSWSNGGTAGAGICDLQRSSCIAPSTATAAAAAIGTITAGRYRQRHDIPADLAIVAAELGPDDLLSLTFAARARRRRSAGSTPPGTARHLPPTVLPGEAAE